MFFATTSLRAVGAVLILLVSDQVLRAEDGSNLGFRVLVDGAVMSQADSNAVFAVSASIDLRDQVVAAKPRARPQYAVRAFMLPAFGITSVALRLDYDDQLKKRGDLNTPEFQILKADTRPLKFIDFEQPYDFAGIHFERGQLPVLLDHYGQPNDTAGTFDLVYSFATWRYGLTSIAAAICQSNNVDGNYSIGLSLQATGNPASINASLAKINLQCSQSPITHLARHTKLELQFKDGERSEFIECDYLKCKDWYRAAQ